jgi:death-on-curing protein
MPPVAEQLDLADLCIVAESIIDVPAEDIARIISVPRAESALYAPFASFGGIDFYPELPIQAAVLCSRIIRNHPLPDGNKRLGYVAMRLFLSINRCEWQYPPGGMAEIAEVIEALAASEITEEEFVGWVAGLVMMPSPAYE